jgi:hypothetical protein
MPGKKNSNIMSKLKVRVKKSLNIRASKQTICNSFISR